MQPDNSGSNNSRSCGRRALAFDIYKQPIKLRTPDRNESYRTITGAIFSCFTFLLVMSYGGVKLQALILL